MTVTRANPYESPRLVQGDESQSWFHRLLPSRTLRFLLAFVPLAGTTSWAIYHTSPIGVFLPAAIAVVAATWFHASIKTSVSSMAFAYVVGVAAIILAVVVTDSIFDPMRLNDDSWAAKVTRVWSGCGILGAFTGAMLGIRIGGHSGAGKDRTTPCTEELENDFPDGDISARPR